MQKPLADRIGFFCNDIKIVFFLGCVIGAVCFLYLWGFEYLNIYNIDWIMYPAGTDFAFAGIGSIEFLQEPWAFPPGIINNLIYPNQTSIIYIDGVPIFALLFKCLASIIPGTFQYFGIWGFLCFVLQGGFAAIIMHKYTRNWLLSVVASVFFIMSPFICMKIFRHISMSGQWIILAALAIVWYRDSSFIRRHEFSVWIVTCMLSVSILAYFTAMVYSILIIYIWCRLLESRNKRHMIKKMTFLFLCTAIGCALVFWLCGGFVKGLETSSMDYGTYPSNLNGLINPLWASYILQSLPLGNASYEGYCWLGLGIIVGLILCFFSRIEEGFPNKAIVINSLPFIVISVCLLAFSATNKMMFGNWVLVDIHLPAFLLKLCSMFRTSGRFVWPVYYMILIWVLGSILTRASREGAKLFIISLLLTIQILDYSKFYQHFSKQESESRFKTSLNSVFWNDLKLNYDHIYFVPFSGKTSHETWGEITWAAVQNRIKLNTFWLGRYPLKKIMEGMEQKTTELNQGKMGEREIVVLNMLNTMRSIQLKENIGLYFFDNVFLLLNKSAADLTQFPEMKKLGHDTGSLAAYLNRLRLEKTNRLIILSARDNNVVKLDPETKTAIKNLGIHVDLDKRTNYGFIWVAQLNKGTFYEALSSEPLQKHGRQGELLGSGTLGADIDISVNLDFSRFPEIKINGVDCSQAFNGLNVCVYDLEQKRIDEIAVFDLYAMEKGVWVYDFVA